MNTSQVEKFTPPPLQDLATRKSRRNALLCALLFGVCVLLARPIADAPFGDDFSYTKTALDFARTGRFLYNGWATAMLGWQVLWGALFIKLFGFSFNVLRLSTLPLGMASVYLFHQILVRFGIGTSDAAIGTLTLGLSPLFFLIATTYLSDVPGVFVIIVCIYMCQRALVASANRAALLWIVSASVINLIGGTVRQTSWLGLLVMVPSTAWLMRRRPGVFPAGIVTTLAGMAGVVACMHWASRQPFFVVEILYIYPKDAFPLSILGQYLKAFLCLMLVLTPITVGWLPAVRSLNRAAIFRITALLCLIAGALLLHGRASLTKWTAPWLVSFLQFQGSVIPHSLWIVLSVLVIATVLILAEMSYAKTRSSANGNTYSTPHLRAAIWILGPFSAASLFVLVTRAATTVIQDRYLLTILPASIVFFLLFYERWIGRSLPPISIAALGLFGLFTVGASHDIYADLRAAHAATQELLAHGIPRTSIEEAFGADYWAQLENAGYINSWNMVTASTNYNPHVPPMPYLPGCAAYQPSRDIPTIRPTYLIAYSMSPCLSPTGYPPITFRAWLPPFQRARIVARLRTTPEIVP